MIRQISDEEILIEVGGEQFVTAAACPHRKGRLVFGLVNARTLRITCPLHYSTFDLRTGEHLSGPACSPLPVRAPEGPACQ